MLAPLPSFSLDGHLIIITGASQGIGKSFAETYAALGAKVVLAARDLENLNEVKDGIIQAGGWADALQIDVTNLDEISKLADHVGTIIKNDQDIKLALVNNAGLGFTKAALDISEDNWDNLYGVNVKGTFFCCQKIAPYMLERGYGKIINLSSTWSKTSGRGKSAYSSSKAAVSQLTVNLSTEWLPEGIRVNAIAPTATRTPFTAVTMAADPARFEGIRKRIMMGRFVETSDLLGAAVFLASQSSDFISGQTLFVDGGFV
jgi:NAD(P)-dependent dehydrogenase (short-subunit alcohol dehydrogenase family)